MGGRMNDVWMLYVCYFIYLNERKIWRTAKNNEKASVKISWDCPFKPKVWDYERFGMVSLKQTAVQMQVLENLCRVHVHWGELWISFLARILSGLQPKQFGPPGHFLPIYEPIYFLSSFLAGFCKDRTTLLLLNCTYIHPSKKCIINNIKNNSCSIWW